MSRIGGGSGSRLWSNPHPDSKNPVTERLHHAAHAHGDVTSYGSTLVYDMVHSKKGVDARMVQDRSEP